MGWAKCFIDMLSQGKTVKFRPRGHSMKGKINSGQLVTVIPTQEDTELDVGDIVLCKVSGREYLHLIKAIQQNKGTIRYQIGNNKEHINGWITRNSIFGKCTEIE